MRVAIAIVRSRLLLWPALILSMALGIVSCGSDGSSSTPTPTPTGISAQPTSASAVAGAAATFSVVAVGDGLAYQWQRSTDAGATFTAISGATASSYTIAAVDATLNGYQYRVVVTGAAGVVTSSAVTLTVTAAVVAPTITTQPVAQSVVAGGTASFSVTAAGTSITYQWQSTTDGVAYTNVSGATGATLTLTGVTTADSGRSFRVVITNSVGSVTSSAVVLTVTPVPSVPIITTQPTAASVVAPATATFSVTASGTPAVSYQWQVSTDGGTTFVDIAGATGANYTTPVTTTADSGKLFRVRVFNTAGSVVSSAVGLTVAPTPLAPSISSQPVSQSVIAPATATFSVVASGSPTPNYQWQLSVDNGLTFANITGATGASYTTAATSGADNGKQFRVVITNAIGTVTSSAATLTVATAFSGVARVAAGSVHTCAIKSDATVACWGSNAFGALGDGTNTDRLTPNAVPGLAGVVDLTVGIGHTCALRSVGTVTCWGQDGEGELGDNRGPNPTSTLSLVTVVGLTNAVAISAGGYHTCAVRSDSTVVCWGLNQYGQLGDGTTANRYVPVVVPGLSNVVSIAAGLTATCALRADGTIYCWGDNRAGQLGDGTLVSKLFPTLVPGVTTASGVSAGQAHSCALLASTNLSCWGSDFYGQLGDGTTVVNRPSPTPITSLTSIAMVSAAGIFTCALKTDGTVYCWGNNDAGTLGDGTATSRSVPAIVPGLNGVVSLSRGAVAGHMCAAKSDGSLLCWGADGSGQLGISATTIMGSVRTPTPVLNITVVR